jgi:hypothetical protein
MGKILKNQHSEDFGITEEEFKTSTSYYTDELWWVSYFQSWSF